MFVSHLRSVMITMSLLMGMVVIVRADEAAVKRAITAQYDKRVAAFKAKDLKGLFASTTNDFSVKRPTGSPLTRTQLETDFKKQFINTKTIKQSTYQITKWEVKEDRAIASFKSHFAVVLNQGGRYHEFDSAIEGRDTWVKTSSGWKLKLEEVTKESVLKDGKKL